MVTERLETVYENLSNSFIRDENGYNRQYADLYFCRLSQMRPRIERKIKESYTEEICRSCNATPKSECIILVGTIYKSMKLKPSVLKQYLADYEEPITVGSFLSDTDTVFLEDETSRVLLTFDKSAYSGRDPSALVTGLVVGVRGFREHNALKVVNLVIGGLPLVSPPKRQKEGFVGFISGVCISDEKDLNRVSNVAHSIVGTLPKLNAESICRIILAGGCIGNLGNTNNELMELEKLDSFISSIASCCPVDLMPGVGDPVSQSLPQPPVHPLLFPYSSLYPGFQLTTNPYFCSIDGVRIMGCSGQAVDDFLRYSSLSTPIEALELLTQAGCLAPTAPDTLACFPMYSEDPFCIPDSPDKVPHIIFSANHDQLQFKYLKSEKCDGKLLLLAIPRFSKCPSMVLVNLSTLDVSRVDF